VRQKRKSIEEFKGILQIGVKKAQKVICEMSGMDVEMEIVEISFGDFSDKIMKNSFILRQLITIGSLRTYFYFAMADGEFLKFISTLDENANILDEEYLTDAFLEMGNIISGNIASVFSSIFSREVELSFPKLINDKELRANNKDHDYLFSIVRFIVNEINVDGYLVIALVKEFWNELLKELEGGS